MLVKFGFYSFDKLLNLTDTLLSLVEKNMIDVGIQKEEEKFGKEWIEQKVWCFRDLEYIRDLIYE